GAREGRCSGDRTSGRAVGSAAGRRRGSSRLRGQPHGPACLSGQVQCGASFQRTPPMTLSLARIEELEFQLVDQLAHGDLSNVDRQKAQSALTKLRELKKAWLADHPDILRKASKIHSEPLPRDRGNALNPDDTLASKPSPLAFRAPAELRG